jgi:serine phosphatase RsbU (regulator of sigma subunit)
MLSKKATVWRTTLFGFLFGCCFPLFAYYISIKENDWSWSIENIIQLHQSSYLYYIIDMAPIVLGALFLVIGKFMQYQINYLVGLSELERKMRDENYNSTFKFSLRKIRVTYLWVFLSASSAMIIGLILFMTNFFEKSDRAIFCNKIQSCYQEILNHTDDYKSVCRKYSTELERILSYENHKELKPHVQVIKDLAQSDQTFEEISNIINAHYFNVQKDYFHRHLANQKIVIVICSIFVLIIVSLFLYTHFYIFAPNFLYLQKAVIENTAARNLIQKQSKELMMAKEEKEESLKELNMNLQLSAHLRQMTKHKSKPLTDIFSQSFVIDKPLQTLSGDFTWQKEIDSDNVIVVLGDCIGHGVAGMMVSNLYEELLEKIIKETDQPDEILMSLDREVKKLLNNNFELDEVTCDMGVARINKKTKEITFSGSHIDLYLLDKDIQEYKCARNSIGSKNSALRPQVHQLRWQEGAWLFMFSDGIKNIINANNVRMGAPGVKKILLSEKLSDQNIFKEKIEKIINEYTEGVHGNDDLTVLGIYMN